ncbi:GAF domain-containing protein [Dactylosporangium sp. NPDC005572]|uniref:GAF domain-containing sensor histidine kinase n=1 Tax=Dactylosporangium sp. NPDC005572 TaxID=3156889 RepID=UPI0033A3F075
MAPSPKWSIDELARFAEARAALHRIAARVARGAPQAELFDVIATELGQLIGGDGATIVRNEPGGTATVVAVWRAPGGVDMSPAGRGVAALVSYSGHSARVDSHADAPGQIAALLRDLGIRSVVGAPILVEGRVWGVTTVSIARDGPPVPDAEARLADATDLVAAAIANAQARAELAASRARAVRAADRARQQLERDLHDGIQQHLIALAIELADAVTGIPSAMPGLRQRVSAVTHGLTGVLDDLRAIARGTHPAILSDVGLWPALKGLVRRSPVPVELDANLDARLPEPVEVTVYYLVAEALANAAKHARAARVRIRTAVLDGRLHLRVDDDGVGGADPARGSGLAGLTDRVDALGGTIMIRSPAGHGTHLRIELPLDRAV